MKSIGAIFGGAKSAPQGPDPSVLAAQQRQEAKIAEAEAEEKKRLKANRSLVAARQGGGASATLNPLTGSKGVSETLG